MSLSLSSPLIESFTLYGVNGYKDIQLYCESGAKIVSAENGSGKTTLLNALYAVLTGNAAQLQKINFEKLSLKLKGFSELIVSKAELSPLPEDILTVLASKASPLFDYVEDETGLLNALTKLSLGQSDEFYDSEWFGAFYRASPFDRDDIESMCSEIVEGLPKSSNRIAEMESYVNDAFGNTKILYLPTYRRIEAEMPSAFRKQVARPRRTNFPPPYSRRKGISTWAADQLIYFGLEDVESRLREISDSIKSGTFDAYTRIGGRTLEQLLAGPGPHGSFTPHIDLADLNVVLARLGKANGKVEERISELISSGAIQNPQHDYLRSFLGQLLEVYAANKDQEQAIEAFVSIINSYWMNDFDEKKFVFDKLTISASVENSSLAVFCR